jgi:hypothetical protein
VLDVADDDKSLDDALADSFPASDPIACTNPTTGTRRASVAALLAQQRSQHSWPRRQQPWRLGMLAAFIIGFLLARRR